MLMSLPPPAVLSLVASFPAAGVLLVPTTITTTFDEGEAVAQQQLMKVKQSQSRWDNRKQSHRKVLSKNLISRLPRAEYA